MKIDLFYICPTVDNAKYGPLADQFYQSLWEMDDTVNCRDGFPIVAYETIRTGAGLGKDIGAYLRAARFSDADIMICIGSHVHINCKGWLNRVVEVWDDHGPGLYGPFGSEQPNHHLRTTAFWCPPALLKTYPYEVDSDQDRYNFELDKKKSISAYAAFMDMEPMQVTASDVLYDTFDPLVGLDNWLMLDRFTDMALASK